MNIRYMFITALCLLLCCASLSVPQSRRAATARPIPPPPPPKPVATEDVSGTLEGSTYTNKFFGFTLTLPDGWQAQDKDVQQQLTRRAREKAKEFKSVDQRAAQSSVPGPTLLLLAIKPTNGATNPIFFAAAENIALAFNIRTPPQYIAQVRRYEKESPVVMEDKVTTERVGGVEFAVVGIRPRDPTHAASATVQERYYVTLRKNHAISFVLTYHTPDQMQACLDVLNSLTFTDNQNGRSLTYGDPQTQKEPLNVPITGGGTGMGVGSGEGGGYGPGRGGNMGAGDKNQAGTGDNRPDYNRVFRMSQVSNKAVIISKPAPIFTEEARKNDVEGVVRIQLVLASNGQVTNIRAVTTLPYGLTEQAIEAARQIRFKPAMKDGHPVSQYATIDYSFNIYYDEDEVTTKAVINSKPPPEYTEEARQNHVQGTVVLKVILTKSGGVTDINVVKGLPYGLTEKAIAAATRIKFEPAVKDGHPVSQYTTIEYEFEIP